MCATPSTPFAEALPTATQRDVDAQATPLKTLKIPTGLGVFCNDHDDPFQASARGSVLLAFGEELPAALQKLEPRQATVVRSGLVDRLITGAATTEHAVPFHFSARRTLDLVAVEYEPIATQSLTDVHERLQASSRCSPSGAGRKGSTTTSRSNARTAHQSRSSRR